MARVVVVTPPEPIVSLEEAKRQLRVEHANDDDLILDLVAIATATIDGPGGWLGRAIGGQTLELRAWCFERSLVLPYGPVASVESVTYLDPDSAPQTLAPESYRLEADHVLSLHAGWSTPTLASRSDAVRIRYVAGWPIGEGPGAARWTGPAPIRHAILMMVTRLYAARGEDRPANLVENPAIAALLAPWRVWSL